MRSVLKPKWLLAQALAALVLINPASVLAGTVNICLPERFRLLTDQRFDLRVEASGLATAGATLTVSFEGASVASDPLPAPEVSDDNDADPATSDRAWTFRGLSIGTAGVHTIRAVVSDGGQTITAAHRVGVQLFEPRQRPQSIILFIGDAMGTAYRDAGRIVSRSTHNRLRQGFFDQLQEMDSMPVTGMVMTHSMNKLVPDSANAATAWTTGAKTVDGALGVLPDGDDFRFDPRDVQRTKRYALNNPRIETLWQYLRRRHGYKTGVVTTADVTDATPAGEGAHSITRSLQYDIARQFVDGAFTPGPVYDVLLGGGLERFASRTPENSGDRRDLLSELQESGYALVKSRTELMALPEGRAAPSRLVGLFRTGNMNVAYDKLGLKRPPDEPRPSLAGFEDQPFLDEMTAKAIAILNREGGPFILLVEGASIDKQSHDNHAAGSIWEVIELDKAVGVGRAFATTMGSQGQPRPLILVTADHDQSMHIIGVADVSVAGAVPNTRSNSAYPVGISPPPAIGTGTNPGEVFGFPDYQDRNGDGYPENENQRRIAVGFRTGNHTGSSVPVTAEGPGALLFMGYYDQTDLFFKMAKVLSSDTSALDKLLIERSKLQIVDQTY